MVETFERIAQTVKLPVDDSIQYDHMLFMFWVG